MMKFKFDVLKKDPGCEARRCTYQTPHGVVETPVFMPVGTQGTVKAMSPKDLVDCEVPIILNNTYHMYLRPGHELVERRGGLHSFINWGRPILTDSGGFQVFSLLDLNKITDDGVKFRSHVDGSYHFFSPESVMNIQRSLGADIIMAFDECVPYPCEEDYADYSQKRTTRWAERCLDEFGKYDPKFERQHLFGIVQGSMYPRLRKESAKALVDLDFPGYSIGGLSVGESHQQMYDMLEVVGPILPKEKPRYLMGVGMPENIIEGVKRGIDMFDCVIPTRLGRNGTVFTFEGKLNIRNSKFKEDDNPIDSSCSCYACRNFSRAYLRHLLYAGEILGVHLLTYHNIWFFMELTRRIRKAIEEGNYMEFSREFLDAYLKK